jgi:hypothetical protein
MLSPQTALLKSVYQPLLSPSTDSKRVAQHLFSLISQVLREYETDYPGIGNQNIEVYLSLYWLGLK